MELRSPQLGAISGFMVAQPTEKQWESLLWCMQQKDHSIINNGTQRKGSLNPQSQHDTLCGISSKFFRHLLCLASITYQKYDIYRHFQT